MLSQNLRLYSWRHIVRSTVPYHAWQSSYWLAAWTVWNRFEVVPMLQRNSNYRTIEEHHRLPFISRDGCDFQRWQWRVMKNWLRQSSTVRLKECLIVGMWEWRLIGLVYIVGSFFVTAVETRKRYVNRNLLFRDTAKKMEILICFVERALEQHKGIWRNT